ncbi:MAG: Gldg family protein [Cyanobacteria bacterium P01_A01_bin.135]
MRTVPIQRLRYLFWLGPIFIVVGAAAGLVSGSWGPLPLTLVLGGGLLLALWLLSESNSLPEFLGRRSTQAGTNAALATVAVLIILAILNGLAVRYNQRVDLTESQLFTLSSQTQAVLADLDQPVKAWIFWDSNDPNSVNEALLENYQRQSEQFTYEVVDPQESPGVARQFEVQTFGEIYLEAGDQRRLVETIGPQQPLTETSLTSGIVNLLTSDQPLVYLLQGHGERPLDGGQGGFAQAETLLESEIYQVEPLNLGQADLTVPDDASVVIVAGPTRALLAGEVVALQQYVNDGGGLLLLLDPDSETGLEPLLEDWDLELSDRLILDPTAQAANLGATTTLVQQYGDHPITESFGDGFTFFVESQPVELVGEVGETQTAPLLITGPDAQAVLIPEGGEAEADPEDILQGPLVLGVALSRDPQSASGQVLDLPPLPGEATPEEGPDTAEGNSEASSEAEIDGEPEVTSPNTETDTEADAGADAPESRLVAIGNSSFAINGIVNQQLNGDLLLNSVGWLAQQSDTGLTIRPKEAANRRIVLTPQRWITTALTAVVVLPLIGFGGAIALWLRRR